MTSKTIIDEKALRELAEGAKDHAPGSRMSELARACLALLNERRLLLDVLREAERVYELRYFDADLGDAVQIARAAVAGLPYAMPWVEPGLYVECPYCNETNLLESDASVSESSIPSHAEAYKYNCEHCGKDFMVGPE